MGGFEPHPTTPRRPQETHTLGKACRATCACAVYEQFWHLRCSPLRPPKWRHWHRDRPWGVSQRCRPRWTSTAHFLCSPGDLSLGSVLDAPRPPPATTTRTLCANLPEVCRICSVECWHFRALPLWTQARTR